MLALGMSGCRLAHVMLFVKDVDRMVEFYATVFGWARRETSDPGYVEMVSGTEVMLALHLLPEEIARRVEISTPPAWRGDSAIKICVEVEHMDARRTLLLAHGGQAKDPWSWERTQFCECADPEGNVLQILRPPS